MATSKTTKKADSTKASGGGLAATTSRKMAVTSPGVTDITTESCDSVSIENLKARPDLQLAPTEAVKEIIHLDKLETNLKLAISRQRVTRLGIIERTEQVKTAGAAYDYSAEVSRTEDKKDNAFYQEEKTALNKQIRRSKVKILVGEKHVYGARAQKAEAATQAYQEVYGADSFNQGEVYDAEYS